MLTVSDLIVYNALFWCAFAASAVITRLITVVLLYRHKLAHPGDRCIHHVSRPIGGGWAVVPVISIMMFAAGFAMNAPLFYYAVILSAFILMILSWYDDLKSLSPSVRFTAQTLAVTVCLILAPSDWLIFDGHVPVWLDRLMTGIAWLWFINLYNFMDGIDGMTGIETTMLGVGGSILLILTISPDPLVVQTGWILGGAGLGFLVWNWQPARIFIGDTGSIPLGFLMGWFLLSMGVNDLFWAAVLISLYYCMDASLTILSRILKGKKFWEADQSYAFQQAVIKGYEHDQVVKIIILLNIFLFAAALTVTFCNNPYTNPFIVAISGCLTGLIIAHFHGKVDIDQIAVKKRP